MEVLEGAQDTQKLKEEKLESRLDQRENQRKDKLVHEQEPSQV